MYAGRGRRRLAGLGVTNADTGCNTYVRSLRMRTPRSENADCIEEVHINVLQVVDNTKRPMRLVRSLGVEFDKNEDDSPSTAGTAAV